MQRYFKTVDTGTRKIDTYSEFSSKYHMRTTITADILGEGVVGNIWYIVFSQKMYE